MHCAKTKSVFLTWVTMCEHIFTGSQSANTFLVDHNVRIEICNTWSQCVKIFSISTYWVTMCEQIVVRSHCAKIFLVGQLLRIEFFWQWVTLCENTVFEI